VTTVAQRLLGGPDPAVDAGYLDPPQRKGFFTDTSICIGCKACEVACKEWNDVPEDGPFALSGMSYDNTVGLGASTWRHVAFIEHAAPPCATSGDGRQSLRWLMESDVCKHCTRAGCLDVCPTGALIRTEFGTVVVQDDICNGCGYCVPACPFGVIGRRRGPEGDRAIGLAQKCTLCYDRLKDDLEPACAQACPTKSIQFGPLGELRERARDRVASLAESGVPGAQLYGHEPGDGVGGAGAFFLLLDAPEVYGLPPDPAVGTRDLPEMWRGAALAAVTMAVCALGAFVRARR
jgi:formate dehydrogenase iron-sulfur subunit